MRYFFILAIFLAGCQSNMQPVPKQQQIQVLDGASFGRMTTSSKISKNSIIKKAGFTPKSHKDFGNQTKIDYKSLKDNIEPFGAKVNLIGRDIIITMFDDLLFQSRLSVKLKPNAESVLSEISSYLNNRKNSFVEITGYTDTVGNANANQRLSMEKSRRVTLYFIQNGSSPIRFYINGRGENSPISKNPKLNRRIDVRISPMVK
ncbi:MAG: OmpA family protein [Alphaproteobacteria bacterium]